MNITDTLRIKRVDDRNIIIEKYETTVNPVTKKENSSWKREGFYPTFRHALEAIVRKDMLIDLEQLESLKRYQESIDKTVNQLTKIIKEEKKLYEDLNLKYENEQLRKQIEKLEEEE